LWAAVLLPDLLRRRTTRRSSDSISSFSRHLSVLERSHQRSTGSVPRPGNVVRFGARPAGPLSTPVAPLVARRGATPGRPAASPARPAPAGRQQAPGRQPAGGRSGRSAAQQRRQDVIVGLLAASLLSFLATVTFSGLFLILHLVIDAALVAYVGAVLALTRRKQARSQVAYLPQRSPMSSMVTVPAQQRRHAAR
jgi:hypothetical protein